MIRVMLYLDPGGITPTDQWETMGRIDIENDALNTLATRGKRGTYIASIYKKRARLWKKIKLRDFPRESYHPWEMVRQILNKAAESNGGRI
jgi:hypothetical protein